MSIIEKAVSKLGQDGPAPEPTTGQKQPATEVMDDAGAATALNASEQKTEEPPTHTTVTLDSPALDTADDANALSSGIQVARTVEINIARLQELGMITSDGGRTAIAEEFRHIKRPLIQNAFSKSKPIRHGNLIMITSALPGEGKTFCAINLAMSIAMEMDHTVLLVDADVARPSIPRHLGIEAEAGLMDLLLDDKRDPASVILNTNIERVRILPSGKSHKRATELLASQVMSNLLNEIANRYSDRIVIFDSPPVLLTSEARALANQMGQIVLVVAAESTTQHGVKDTLRRIGSNSNISLIYNKARDFPGMGYYGGYY